MKKHFFLLILNTSFLSANITPLFNEPEDHKSEVLKNIICHYDEEASSYDKGYSSILCQAEDEILISIIKPHIGDKVLDIGCGTGIILEYLNIQDYFGIDISPEMVNKAVSKHPNKDFIAADMEEVILKLNSNLFDSLVCLYGPFSYALNPEKLMHEFYRVLKPGGTLIVMPYTKRLENNFFIGDYSTSVCSEIPKTFYTTKMLNDLMNKTNFENIEIIGINYFGNIVETMNNMYGISQKKEDFVNFLSNELKAEYDFPIEYARHSLLIAKKPNTL